MTLENAQIIALKAMTFIFANDQLSDRFIQLSGYSPDAIAEAVQSDDTDTANYVMMSVIEFLLNFEPDLLAFAANDDLRPEDIQKAWITLGGNPEQLGM